MGEVIYIVGVVAFAETFNRNIGVLQTAVAELVTTDAHQRKFLSLNHKTGELTDFLARAYSIMPFVWCLGCVSFLFCLTLT
jgi:hypothetical protein